MTLVTDHPNATLQAARRRVAERKPGCAWAILAGHWDNGALVKAAVESLKS